MNNVTAKSNSFAKGSVDMTSVVGVCLVLAFLFAGISGTLFASIALVATVFIISFLRITTFRGVVLNERDALARSDSFFTFALGLMHFAALPMALYSFTYDGVHVANWAFYVLGFGMFFGSLSFNTAHMLIHSNNRMYRSLGRVIYSSLGFGTFVSAHIMVHHPRIGTARDLERVRPGERWLRYAARVYFSGIRLGRRAESLRRKAFNYGQLDIVHPHAQYVLFACVTALISALLFGPMGLLNWFLVSLVARMYSLTTMYLRNK